MKKCKQCGRATHFGVASWKRRQLKLCAKCYAEFRVEHGESRTAHKSTGVQRVPCGGGHRIVRKSPPGM